MRPSGASSNRQSGVETPAVQSLVTALAEAIDSRIVAAIARAHQAILKKLPPGRGTQAVSLRPRMGVIQGEVLKVLQQAAPSPMRTPELRAAVEVRLKIAVSRDTVSSFLSVASRSERWPVVRVNHGLYRCKPGKP